MYNQPSRVRYAYGGVRVSSKEQGLKDSPQAQLEQINRYAEHNNIVIIDFIKFYESGSKKTNRCNGLSIKSSTISELSYL